MGEGSHQSPGEKLELWRGPSPAYALSLEILTCYKLYSTLFNAQCNIDFVNNCDYLELNNNLIRKYTLHCSSGPAAGPRGWAGAPRAAAAGAPRGSAPPLALVRPAAGGGGRAAGGRGPGQGTGGRGPGPSPEGQPRSPLRPGVRCPASPPLHGGLQSSLRTRGALEGRNERPLRHLLPGARMNHTRSRSS